MLCFHVPYLMVVLVPTLICVLLFVVISTFNIDIVLLYILG
jgi:hypothetical protein